MNNLSFATIHELSQALKDKKISVSELISFFSQQFSEHDGALKSALEIFSQESIEHELKNASATSLLSGIPGLIKDNICQKGRIASCSSKMLENYRASYDATAIERLKAVGAPLLGRANMDEFAMGSSTETSAFFKTANPWDISRVPGGSSGGSAACVAAGLVPWALGSDTGGSVRQPASFCNIVGSKPTYGLVSRYGLIAYASSLDQIGVLTRTVHDNAVVMSEIAGHDERDSTSLRVKKTDYTQFLQRKLPAGLKIGVVTNAFEAEGMDADVVKRLQDVLAVYEKSGAVIKRLSLPAMDYGAAVYFMVSRAEAASNLARFDGIRYGYRDTDAKTLSDVYVNDRSHGFGAEVKRRILIGNYALSSGHADAYYQSAKTVQALMRQQFLQAFKEVDLLFMPTTPSGAFKFGAFDNDRLKMDLQDYFNASANLTGVPALSIPAGFTSDGLPVGFQLIGPDLSEGLLFNAAYAYEQQTPWHTMMPPAYSSKK
jgi:aspartyl-tRNA(Asn)/glutamyl-tRNA(Gln) amidotransferase subunit A